MNVYHIILDAGRMLADFYIDFKPALP